MSGLAQSYRGRLQLANQEVEVLRGEDVDTVHVGRITPVHRAAEGITSRTVRELVWAAVQRLGRVPEPIPADDPLLSLDNCLVVPHIASASRDRQHTVRRATHGGGERSRHSSKEHNTTVGAGDSMRRPSIPSSIYPGSVVVVPVSPMGANGVVMATVISTDCDTPVSKPAFTGRWSSRKCSWIGAASMRWFAIRRSWADPRSRLCSATPIVTTY